MAEVKRDFKGIWIPKSIWLSSELTLQEKVFLVEIDSLDNDEGCYAKNAHFAKFFGLSPNRCSEVIKSLEKKGFVGIKYIRNQENMSIEKRVIRVIEKSNRASESRQTPSESRQTPSESRQTPSESRQTPSGKCEESNTFNNTVNNTVSNTEREAEPDGGGLEIDKSIEIVAKEYEKRGFGYPGTILDQLKLLVEEYPVEWIVEALLRATMRNKRSLTYVQGILRGFRADGGIDSEVKPNGSNSNTKQDDQYAGIGFTAEDLASM